ncbi:glycosyltransferase [Bifidobacterium thermophilum]|uniref:Glycosyltransferase n=1 Tax=Bifidobacterium thermophilum RBL67 TaxID=1254439 RepID=M4RB03_9BIFI|nr:glycosyltransferase [Bifidobacterium thermophilum]AGH40646.1 glycosyltransferase [Bifidobacterium thermophilum RBL67]MDW8486831.1 glycosyltransferase [Bifidobacterium thermophilum]
MQQHHQSDKSSLTIIIPCCNEEESLPLLFKRLDQLIASDDCSITCTILFIDDGSRDSTPQEIKQYAGPVRDIILSRNFGKENAMFACGWVLVQTPYELRIQQTFTGIAIL